MLDLIQLMVAPVVAGLVILSIHAYFGLHVIARGVIFVDLAFAQIAALGTTTGVLIGAEPGTSISLLLALGFTVLGAVLFSFTRLEHSIVPQEAIIGISYVVASAAVILLASFTAEGAEHVAETMTGTLIWVGWAEIWKIAAAYVVLGVFHYVFRKPLLEVTFNRSGVGNARLWDFIFYVTFGIAISFSVAVAGVLMVFSALVIPAVIAFLFTDKFRTALFIAWGVGGVAIIGGIVTSFVWDVATGPLLVVFFGLVLVVAFIVRPLAGAKPGSEVKA